MKYWDKAWSLVDGCTPVSEGCEHCWSASIVNRFGDKSPIEYSYDNYGNRRALNLIDSKGKWTGKIRIREDRLDIPLRTRKPTVFSIWNDLFHEGVPFDFIHEVLWNCFNAEKHKFLILTKRAKRLYEFYDAYNDQIYWDDDIYFGITAENQQRLDERLPYLLEIPCKRFISIEPILDRMALPNNVLGDGFYSGFIRPKPPLIHQIIIGAETGHHARPANLDWFRSLRDQCNQAGIPFFLKQVNAKRERLLDGKEHNELVWRR